MNDYSKKQIHAYSLLALYQLKREKMNQIFAFELLSFTGMILPMFAGVYENQINNTQNLLPYTTLVLIPIFLFMQYRMEQEKKQINKAINKAMLAYITLDQKDDVDH